MTLQGKSAECFDVFLPMFSKSSLHLVKKMRTNRQQDVDHDQNNPRETIAMMTQIKIALERSQDTLWQDTVGAASLVVMLFVALHLPGLF